jgi:hypothetical protein
MQMLVNFASHTCDDRKMRKSLIWADEAEQTETRSAGKMKEFVVLARRKKKSFVSTNARLFAAA